MVGVECYGDGSIDVVLVHGVELGGGEVISKIPEQGGEVFGQLGELYLSFDFVVVASGVGKIGGGASEDGNGHGGIEGVFAQGVVHGNEANLVLTGIFKDQHGCGLSGIAFAGDGPLEAVGVLAMVIDGDCFSFTCLVGHGEVSYGLVVDGHTLAYGIPAIVFVGYQQLNWVAFVFGKCVYKIQVLRYRTAVDQPLGIVVVGRGVVEADQRGHATLAVFGKIKVGLRLGIHGDDCTKGVIGAAIVIDGYQAGQVGAVIGINVAGIFVD